jgi:hypothetical protein
VYLFPNTTIHEHLHLLTFNESGVTYDLDLLPISFESVDLKLAHQEAKNFVRFLESCYDVGFESMRVAYSGSSGFQVLIPSELFGTFIPSSYLPIVARQMAQVITEGFGTANMGMYYPTSMIRFTNTMDSHTKQYKILLNFDEFMNHNVSDIIKLATSPRESDVEMLPRSELSRNVQLTKLYNHYRNL